MGIDFALDRDLFHSQNVVGGDGIVGGGLLIINLFAFHLSIWCENGKTGLTFYPEDRKWFVMVGEY